MGSARQRIVWLGGLMLALMSPVGAGAAEGQLPALTYNPGSAETLRFIVAASQVSPYIELATLGRSARGRQIPVAILRDPAVAPLDLRRIMILCRQHGNEPAGTLAALRLIRDVAEGQAEAVGRLRRLCLLIVPMVNPDGADANQRANANGVDLNRDWVRRSQPETQAVENLYNLWKPQVVLDLHELHWNDAHGRNTIEAPVPGVVDDAVTRESQELQNAILARLDRLGFPVRVSVWDNSTNMNLCHRHFARDHGRVSLLFESERQGLKTPLPRRAEMHRVGLQTVLEYYSRDGYAPPRLAMVPPSTLPAAGDEAVGPAGENAAVYLGPAIRVEPRVTVVSPDLTQPLARGKLGFQLELEGIADLTFVSVALDGQGRFFSNRAPFAFDLDTSSLAEGVHVVLVKAHRRDGTTVEREYVVTVPAAE